MPTVQTYGARKVSTARLPGARLTAAETPESQGAGLASAQGRTAGVINQIGRQVGALGESLYGQAQEEQRHADQVALMEAENKLSSWENQRLYDPENGALGVKGKAAMGLPETVNGDYQKFAGEIEQGLTTDRQREAFAVVAGRRGQSIDLTLQRHVFGEIKQYESDELTKLIDNKKQEAIQNAADPRRVGVALNDAIAALESSAPRLGTGPEELAAQKRLITSNTHVGVLEQLLATGQGKQAKVYFDETKGLISGDQLPRIERALAEGDTRGESQKQADAILAAGGTLSEQLAKAKTIDDPAVRDMTEQRLEHQNSINERIQREQSEAALKASYDRIDQTGDPYSIPPSTWASLSGGERSSLLAYAEHRAKGTEVETDLPTYYNLMQTASKEPGIFATANLLKYRDKLGRTEFKQLTELQLAMRRGDKPVAEQALDEFRSSNQIVSDTLNQYGIDPTPKEGSKPAAAIAQLRRMLDLRVAAAQPIDPKTGKRPKITNVEVQRALDDLLGQSANVKGSWWNIWPGGAPFYDTSKKLIDLTIEDVPADAKADITQKLKRRGLPATDPAVLNVYIESQVK
jgi:hypothetical protein